MALTREERNRRMRERKKTPEYQEVRRAYDKARHSTPEYRAWYEARKKDPGFKEKRRIWQKKVRSTLKYKAWKKAYRNSPKAQAARRDQLLRKQFGITLVEYDKMLIAQNHVCAICHYPGEQQRSLAVDHNHRTGKVRGLLCRPCNQSLGLLADDPQRIKRAILYLKNNA